MLKNIKREVKETFYNPSEPGHWSNNKISLQIPIFDKKIITNFLV
jgi:hypothetical protein